MMFVAHLANTGKGSS